MNRLPAGARRALAIAIFLLPFVLVAAGGVAAYAYIERQRAELARAEADVARFDERLAVRERVLSELRLLERSDETASLLVEADTAALAQADLQGRLSALIANAGGQIDSIQTLAPSAVDGFVRLPLRIVFEADMEGLREALHTIETMEPVFVVESLSADPMTADADAGLRVQVSAEVAAFARDRPGLLTANP